MPCGSPSGRVPCDTCGSREPHTHQERPWVCPRSPCSAERAELVASPNDTPQRPVTGMQDSPRSVGRLDPSVGSLLTLESRGSERLRPPSVPQRRQLSQWPPDQTGAAIERTLELLAPGGVCLPIVWMADGLIVPVVSFDDAAVAWRAGHGQGPVIDRTWWRDASATAYASAPPAALSILAFLSVAPLSRARSTLARLRPTAPVAALTPTHLKPDPFELSHWDFYGLPVYAADEFHARTLVVGPAWRPGSGAARHFQTRLRLEQLFDLAIRSGSLTGHSPVA